MIIKEAIVHRMDKDRQKLASITFRKKCLPIDPILQATMEKARKAYGTTSSRAFGIFQDNTTLYPFSALLALFLAKASSMYDFSVAAMALLEKEINGAPFATGGYVIFAEYEENGTDFFIVVLLKLKGGTGIDAVSLDLSENWNLDVDHLHEAARINISNWNSKTGNYISFAKKGSADDFTEYFREFIGCDQYIESKAQTTMLVKAIKSYCDDAKFSPDDAKKLKAKAYEYFSEQARDGKNISLTAMSMRFDDQNPKAFIDYLEVEKIEIGDGFEPHKATFKHLKRVGGKDSDLSINFDRDLLGGRIKYDKINKTLLITELPPMLIVELDAEN